ncbi:MAG: hypothetical protein LBG58_06450 [Planctomycetaceae bacterium]|nr:hypothetical protein [Planctomycetaceae bacterium]
MVGNLSPKGCAGWFIIRVVRGWFLISICKQGQVGEYADAMFRRNFAYLPRRNS